jgi:peptide/nickel transport system substrate-binding protein
VTIEDVMWSFETLGTEGHPRFRTAWTKVETMEQTGPRSVRLTFTEPDRELPLILGLRPILQRAQFEERRFGASSLEPLIGSGPYVVDRFEPGRFVSFRRNPDWWAADLPFYAGQYNFDEIRYDFFGDASVAFEAFRAGDVSVWREPNAARWASSYDFPAVRDGRVRLEEIPHQRPSGMNGFVINTRRAPFDDWRVRDALIHAFDFERINQVINGGLEPRIPSYFGNSDLGMRPGPGRGRGARAAGALRRQPAPGALEGYALPVNEAGRQPAQHARRRPPAGRGGLGAGQRRAAAQRGGRAPSPSTSCCARASPRCSPSPTSISRRSTSWASPRASCRSTRRSMSSGRTPTTST